MQQSLFHTLRAKWAADRHAGFFFSRLFAAIGSVSQRQKLTTIGLFRRYGYIGCMFCRSPPQNLQTRSSQIGHQSPQARARHCGSSWRLGVVCPMARHPSRVERTHVGMHRKLWPHSCLERHWKLVIQTTVG